MRRTTSLAAAITCLMGAGTLDAQEATAPARQSSFALDPAQFDKYAGYYQPAPRSAVRFYREESRYYFTTVGTAQRMEIFPEAVDRFSPGDRPLQFTFRLDGDGIAREVSVNVGGREMIVPRITEQAANALVTAATPPPAPVVHNWTVRITPHRLLTTSPTAGVDYWPAFTADGRRVIFDRNVDGAPANWALYQVPADGGDVRLFFARPGVPVTRASSNRNGRMVFMTGRAIWTIRDDGSDAREVPLKDVLLPSYPSLYPDGKRIVLTDQARSVLLRVDASSGNATPLTREADVIPGMASVSPDGKWIAFAGQKNEGRGTNHVQADNQIWLIDDSGTTRPAEANAASGRTPSWSPDGKRIAFESRRGSPDDHYAIFIMNRDGSALTQLTDYTLNANHPVWSPDGKRLAFSWGSEPGKPGGIGILDAPD